VFPYKTSFQLKRNRAQPLYLQLANQFIAFIKDRKLPPKTKLPGSRTLAALLDVHRKTVVACYEELLLQGWVESIAQKGTFVHADLPELHQREFQKLKFQTIQEQTGFEFYKETSLLERKTVIPSEDFMYLNDGVSDARLTPTEDLARIYRRICGRNTIYKEMSYGATFGNERLRKTLSEYLNKTRGLHTTFENILITRGSQMGLYLSAKLLLKNGDIMVVGETNYSAADISFLHQKSNLIRVPVDENGLVTQEIETICKNQQIKAVFVTSHHHHPTTVTLSAKRRIHLLNLAEKYNFAIIEDDYDYDFNYNHSPILPLASHDVGGNVVYIGSVCKTVAPVFRIGYLIAPYEFVNEAAKQRRGIDRQGDALLELTFEEFIRNGDLDRHIKKVMKIYKARRDLFCRLLKHYFPTIFEFTVPKGGMAIWVQLNSDYSWENISIIARKYQLEIGDWQRYDLANLHHNCIRIGFATYNDKEMDELIHRLKKTMDAVILQEKSF
jgi:GntR family transcriptional regulator/MocR family aminotransferase